MIKNPCYFVTVPKEKMKVMTAICIDCQKEKQLVGWYWDKDFNEQDNEINCHFCRKSIFIRETNEEN